MFSTDKLTMIYGDRVLFQGVSLTFASKRRYGLVGANGAGKTTFLKLIKGIATPSDGIVQVPNEATVGLLDQDFSRYIDQNLLDLVMMGDEALWQALEKKKALLKKETLLEEEIEKLATVEEIIHRKGGYRAQARAASLLSGLGIPEEKHKKPLNALSGGYKLRALLAQLLFIEPDILLLDEPTNYLDIFSIRWLERYLVDYPGTLLLSSHDRLFLNKVCQEIIDIDYGEMRRYVGDFDHFLTEKKKDVQIKELKLQSLEKRKKEIQRFIDRFKAKATKARQAGSRERMIEKLEEEEEGYLLFPSSRKYPHFSFPIHRPSGRVAASIKKISKHFSKKTVLKEVTFEAFKGEKIAIVGANGRGKSTLLEIITSHLAPDEGTVRFGPHVKECYFPQHFNHLLSAEMTLYDWLRGAAKGVLDQKLRQSLGKMLFDEHAVHKKIGVLSGGE
ncbi:MAG: ABC-F family ATP-binding cassette domain-containing protein, partial [Chlamydiia bacterium]|nr:ABC-F family ATP-binding cassette domain-containing protein [Chlamydiia bacterium]